MLNDRDLEIRNAALHLAAGVLASSGGTKDIVVEAKRIEAYLRGDANTALPAGFRGEEEKPDPEMEDVTPQEDSGTVADSLLPGGKLTG